MVTPPRQRYAPPVEPDLASVTVRRVSS